MLFQWLVAIIAVGTLVGVLVSDFWCSKSKHSTYYGKVQKPTGKPQREANIPDPSTHDHFYAKLNHR